MSFELLHPKVRKLAEEYFSKSTEIQKIVIPRVLKDDNVLVIAGTGLGKTESVMLPLFSRLVSEKHTPIAVLYITPLKSLNRDMLDRLSKWCDKLDLEIGVRHGDTPQAERHMQRISPPHVLVTTPESLGALLVGNKMKNHIKNIKYVVIDEIHEMVDNKRGIQLSILLERLQRLTNFQRIGISATIGSPEKVSEFLGKNVLILKSDKIKKYDIKVIVPGTDAKDKNLSEKLFVGESTTSRLRYIADLINHHKSILVFSNTRQTAEVLSSRLRNLDKDISHDIHHGSLSKEKRIKAEQDFKKQKLSALICTSSLELGIDIGSIDLVIQYLSPRQVSRCIQRIGRSGHGIGRISKGIILSDEEDVFESCVIAGKSLKGELEPVKIHDLALDVLANQIVGFTMDDYEIKSTEVYTNIRNAYPYRNLDVNDFNILLVFISKLGLIWLNPVYEKENPEKIIDFNIRRSRRGMKYYFENLSTISDVRKIKIVSMIEGDIIGYLDESFVAEHGDVGNTFICNGRAWKVIQLEEDRLFVEPVNDIESAIPAWEGELIPVPQAVAEEVGEIRSSENLDYPADRHSLNLIKTMIEKQKKTHIMPDKNSILIENYKDFIIIHSCHGSLVNSTIARYLSSKIINETGISVNIKTDPYRIILQTMVRPEYVEKLLKSYDTEERIEDIIKQNISNSTLFRWRFMQVAKRFGIVMRSVKFDKLNMQKIAAQYMGTPVYDETLRELFLEKMDVEAAEKILEEIKINKIKILIQPGLSILGEYGLVHHFSEVMKPEKPEAEFFEAFKRRLLQTIVRMICIRCGFNVPKVVKEIENIPQCPKCLSGMLAVVSRHNQKAVSVIKKHIEKKEMNKEEQKMFNDIKRSASLMITYGKKYAICQAARGIGPDTAARIMSNVPKDDEHLFRLIYDAEKTFRRTKIYWK
ncbi:MAG: DEAD/DEAH box helicase [Candidatus Aenigmarchaeota archaeon]|nr:DEAD/DEAH box helicase [Candidatus Aenigmarchaeota archaeon]